MISRYDGRCKYCNQPTKAGADFYSIDEKISYHERCRAESRGLIDTAEQPEAEKLADELGFK